jgi:hypothetical protein
LTPNAPAISAIRPVGKRLGVDHEHGRQVIRGHSGLHRERAPVGAVRLVKFVQDPGPGKELEVRLLSTAQSYKELADQEYELLFRRSGRLRDVVVEAPRNIARRIGSAG